MNLKIRPSDLFDPGIDSYDEHFRCYMLSFDALGD